MDFLKNKTTKVISIIIFIGIIFPSLFLFTSMYFPNEFEIIMKKSGLFQTNIDPFYTSEKHRQRLGIEIVNNAVPYEEELHSMIKSVYKNGLDYFNSGDDKNFKETEFYFLPEEYERIKQGIDKTRQECQKQKKLYKNEPLYWCEEASKFTLPNIKFSQPRKYKDLPERIGIMALAHTNSPHFVSPIELGYNLFIFKQTNNEWKIEKIYPLGSGFPSSEIGEENAINKLLKKIESEKHKERLGIDLIKLPFEEERDLRLMIEKVTKTAFYFYNVQDEIELETIKNLFLPQEYEKFKKTINVSIKDRLEARKFCDISSIDFYNLPVTIQFSLPRKYETLKGRVGIISLMDIFSPDLFGQNLIDYSSSNLFRRVCRTSQYNLFIFKQTNNKWKIEEIYPLGSEFDIPEIKEENAINELLKK